MKREKVLKIGIAIIYFIAFIIMISCKVNYHMDEMFSYGLANHVGSNRFLNSYETGVRYEEPYKTYLQYLAVGEDNRFNYKQVWANQKNDVHPPMYYVLLHTISSFFPGKFSKWYAGVINIIFGLLAVFLVSVLFDSMVSTKDYRIKCCLMLGFLGPLLHIVTFFRMYMMVMCMIIALEIIFVKLIQTKLNVRDYILLFIICEFGALTHYYFTFYLIISCCVCGMMLIMQRRWKELAILFCEMAFTGALAVAIFPAMVDHVLKSRHGVSAVHKLASMGLRDYLTRIVDYYGYINKQIFGGWLEIIMISVVFLIIYIPELLRRVRTITLKSKTLQKYAFVWISMFMFFLYVSITASYDTDRYIFPIYGVFYVAFWSLILKILYMVDMKKTTYVVIGITLLMLAGSVGAPNEYLYLDSQSFLENINEDYAGKNAVVISKNRIGAMRRFVEVQSYDSVIFLFEKDVDKMLQTGALEDCDDFMLLASDEYDVDKFFGVFPQYKVDKVAGSWGEWTTYHIIKQ